MALRSLDLGRTFPGNGLVRLDHFDAAYHARRAFWTFSNFPSVLVFDPYLAHPDGAVVPHPPLFDWLLGAAARPFASLRAFEIVAAWASPVLAALTGLIVFEIGRRLSGTSVGLTAAWLYAVLPVAAFKSSLGDPDHHAAVGLLAAAWLASSVRFVEEPPPRIPLGRIVAHALVIAAMLLTWSGALLYLLLAEGALLLVGGILRGQRGLLFAQAAGALLAAGLVTPWLRVSEAGGAATFAATTLSWLHVVVLSAFAALCTALAGLEHWWPSRDRFERAARAVFLGGLLAGPLMWHPGLLEAVGPGLGFLAKEDIWAPANLEQQPLFAFLSDGAIPVRPAWVGFGGFVAAVPFAPLLALLGARRRPSSGPAMILAVWCAVLGALAIGQVRFGHDFAAPASVAFALGLAALRRWLAARLPGRERLATVSVALVGVLLVMPGVVAFHVPQVPGAVRYVLKGPADPGPTLSGHESLHRFAEEIRRVTPETSGFLAPGRPEYSILCPPGLGHSVVWNARRPTPAGNFGPYLGAEKLQAVWAFLLSESEREALSIAETLGARYVLTAPGYLRAGSVAHQLHHADGSAGEGQPHVERLRLVTEGPPGGQPLRLGFQPPRHPIPYKLFEIVEGALLEVEGPPETEIVAELGLSTPLGRRMAFRATARTDAGGLARLRVPYPTQADGPTRAVGPYRVVVGGERTMAVAVGRRDVREGRVVRVGP